MPWTYAGCATAGRLERRVRQFRPPAVRAVNRITCGSRALRAGHGGRLERCPRRRRRRPPRRGGGRSTRSGRGPTSGVDGPAPDWDAGRRTPTVRRRTTRSRPCPSRSASGSSRWPPPPCPACRPTRLPVPLRRVAKFAPNRRARLGGPAIAAQLAADPLFRQRISGRVLDRRRRPGRGRGRRAWRPAAADPVEVAALAYLARPDGWRELVDGGRRGGARRGRQRRRRRAGPRRRAAGRPRRARPGGGPGRGRQAPRRAGPGPRGAGPAARGGPGHRPARCARRRPRRSAAAELLATEKGRAARATADHDAEVRRLRARLAEAEAAAGAGKQSAKDARAVDDARLWLLLETIGQAAVGLRRELALGPDRPAAGRLRRGRHGRPARRAERLAARAPGHRRPGPPRPAARPAPGAPDRRRLQRDQARLRRDVAGAAAQTPDHRAGRDRRADRRRGHGASSTAPSGCTGCRRRRAASGCSSPARATPPTS